MKNYHIDHRVPIAIGITEVTQRIISVDLCASSVDLSVSS
jgi:hypothetical protein